MTTDQQAASPTALRISTPFLANTPATIQYFAT